MTCRSPDDGDVIVGFHFIILARYAHQSLFDP
jgi:hypothetical protein